MDTSECEIEYDQRHMRHESTLTRSNILYKERGETGEKGKGKGSGRREGRGGGRTGKEEGVQGFGWAHWNVCVSQE